MIEYYNFIAKAEYDLVVSVGAQIQTNCELNDFIHRYHRQGADITFLIILLGIASMLKRR